MADWVRLCSADEAPAPGSLMECSAAGKPVCLANDRGQLAAMDNLCPHRGGPLSEGWLEDGKVVCPWHAWAFDRRTGECPEERSQVKVYALRREGLDWLVDIE